MSILSVASAEHATEMCVSIPITEKSVKIES